MVSEMGFSLTLSHIIIVIGSVVLASIFSAYTIYTGSNVQNVLMQSTRDMKMRIAIQIEIVYATIDNSTSPPHFVIYAKNVGWASLKNFTYMDVYISNYGEAILFTYNSTASEGSGQFKVEDANGNGIWEPKETACIRAYPTERIEGAVFEAKIVPSTGTGSEYLFSAPP